MQKGNKGKQEKKGGRRVDTVAEEDVTRGKGCQTRSSESQEGILTQEKVMIKNSRRKQKREITELFAVKEVKKGR